MAKSLVVTARSDLPGTAKRAVRYGQLALGALILEALSILRELMSKLSTRQDAQAPMGVLDQLALVLLSALVGQMHPTLLVLNLEMQ